MLDLIIETYRQHHNGYVGPLFMAIIGDKPSLEILTEARRRWKTAVELWVVGDARTRTRDIIVSKVLPKWTHQPHVLIFMEYNANLPLGPMGMILIPKNQAPSVTPKGWTGESLGSSPWIAYNLVSDFPRRQTSGGTHRNLARMHQSTADANGNKAFLSFTMENGNPTSLLAQIGVILELVNIPSTDTMQMLTHKLVWELAFTDSTENPIKNNAMLALQGSHLLEGAFSCYLLERMPDLGPKSATHILQRYLSTGFLADVAAVLQLPMLLTTHRYPDRQVRATLVKSFVGSLYVTGDFKAVMAFVSSIYDQVHTFNSSPMPAQVLQVIAKAMHWSPFKIHTSEGITSVLAAPAALELFAKKGYRGNVTIAEGTDTSAVLSDAVAFLANYNLTENMGNAMRMQVHLQSLSEDQRRRFFSKLLARGFSSFRIDTFDAPDRKTQYQQLIGNDQSILMSRNIEDVVGADARLLMEFTDAQDGASSQRK